MGSDRVRDVIDLQLIMRTGIEIAEILPVCEQLFRYRRCQTWLPVVVKGKGWDMLYDSLRGKLPVLQTADEAIAWVNDLIAAICSSGS